MRRAAVLVIVVLCCSGSTVFAQWLPGVFGGCSKLGPFSLNGYVGYSEYRNGNVFSFDDYTFDTRSYNDTTRFPLKGLWLGLSAEAKLTDGIGCMISGGALVYAHTRASSDLEPFQDFGYELNPHGQWWGYLDATATYSVGILGGTQLLAGLRWDHYNSKLILTYNGFPEIDVEIHFKVNAYLPLVGAQWTQDWWDGQLKVRAVGFPWVPGEMKYDFGRLDTSDDYRYSEVSSQPFTSGYFVELLAEYRKRVAGRSYVGAFVSLNQLHAATDKGKYNYYENSPSSGFDEGSNQTGLIFHRTSLTVGGSFSLDFNLL
ncbi:hypothetical protein ACFL2Q_13855 [Thermodesulfobacteriota bacterium]